MKRTRFVLMAAAAAVLMSGAVLLNSCDKEDDDDNKNKTEQQGEQGGDGEQGGSGEEQGGGAGEQDNTPQGYVNLGLESGTIWKADNEPGLFTHEDAVAQFGTSLPTHAQMEELLRKCTWTWVGNGYRVTGPNGKSIVMPVTGYKACYMDRIDDAETDGNYWSCTTCEDADSRAYSINFSEEIKYGSSAIFVGMYVKCCSLAVRLVLNQPEGSEEE